MCYTYYSSRTFYVFLCDLVTCDHYCDHDITLTLNPIKEKRKKKRELNKETSISALYVWHYVMLNSNPRSQNKKIDKYKIEIRKKNKINRVYYQDR